LTTRSFKSDGLIKLKDNVGVHLVNLRLLVAVDANAKTHVATRRKLRTIRFGIGFAALACVQSARRIGKIEQVNEENDVTLRLLHIKRLEVKRKEEN